MLLPDPVQPRISAELCHFLNKVNAKIVFLYGKYEEQTLLQII